MDDDSEHSEQILSGFVFGTGKRAGKRETTLSGGVTAPHAGNPDDDPVSAPRHYRGDGRVTCADAMRSMSHGVRLGAMATFWWLTALKYLWRWPRKHPDPAGKLQDIDKAIECLRMLREEVTRADEVDPGA